MYSDVKSRVDENGFYLNPEKARKQARKARVKRHKKRGDSYKYKRLHRFCPKCGKEITLRKVLKPNAEINAQLTYKEKILTPTTVYICKCGAVWHSWQVKKEWQRLKRNMPKGVTNKEFKQNLH